MDSVVVWPLTPCANYCKLCKMIPEHLLTISSCIGVVGTAVPMVPIPNPSWYAPSLRNFPTLIYYNINIIFIIFPVRARPKLTICL